MAARAPWPGRPSRPAGQPPRDPHPPWTGSHPPHPFPRPASDDAASPIVIPPHHPWAGPAPYDVPVDHGRGVESGAPRPAYPQAASRHDTYATADSSRAASPPPAQAYAYAYDPLRDTWVTAPAPAPAPPRAPPMPPPIVPAVVPAMPPMSPTVVPPYGATSWPSAQGLYDHERLHRWPPSLKTRRPSEAPDFYCSQPIPVRPRMWVDDTPVDPPRAARPSGWAAMAPGGRAAFAPRLPDAAVTPPAAPPPMPMPIPVPSAPVYPSSATVMTMARSAPPWPPHASQPPWAPPPPPAGARRASRPGWTQGQAPAPALDDASPHAPRYERFMPGPMPGPMSAPASAPASSARAPAARRLARKPAAAAACPSSNSSAPRRSTAASRAEAITPPPVPAPPVSRSALTLRIRQQPIRARMCGCGDKDRRAIDPPPIAQLVDAATGADAWAVSAFYVVQASLCRVVPASMAPAATARLLAPLPPPPPPPPPPAGTSSVTTGAAAAAPAHVATAPTADLGLKTEPVPDSAAASSSVPAPPLSDKPPLHPPMALSTMVHASAPHQRPLSGGTGATAVDWTPLSVSASASATASTSGTPPPVTASEDRTVSSSSTGESAAVSAAVSAVTKTVVVPMPIPTSTRSSPLIGTLVACSMVLHDDQNVRGCFFIFPDLSVRYEGTFVLKLSLISLEGEPMPLLKGETTVASVVYTQPFRVYPPKAFPGMMASSALSRAFARQGCKLPIRRERGRRKRGPRVASEAASMEVIGVLDDGD